MGTSNKSEIYSLRTIGVIHFSRSFENACDKLRRLQANE